MLGEGGSSGNTTLSCAKGFLETAPCLKFSCSYFFGERETEREEPFLVLGTHLTLVEDAAISKTTDAEVETFKR